MKPLSPERENFATIILTVKVNDLSTIDKIPKVIEEGMEFTESEGIVYYEVDVDEEDEYVD
tara:strand:- start:1159 stop:1341 length:183 start_codon:yes stop_codon:yes gene_type:complete